MIRLARFLVTMGLTIPVAAAGSEGNPQDLAGPLAVVREKIVRQVEEKRIPSVSLAVIKDGEIIWEEAFGLADIENKIKATPETIYPIASVTKPSR